jgi:hypothetical protein
MVFLAVQVQPVRLVQPDQQVPMVLLVLTVQPEQLEVLVRLVLLAYKVLFMEFLNLQTLVWYG